MMILEQNTTNDNELSHGLLRQQKILIWISVISPLLISGMASISNENLYGVDINIEQLNIKYILLAAFVIFWILYQQYSKNDANRIMLIKQMDKRINATRNEFFQKVACPSIKDCFGLEDCYILEEEKDLPKSKNNSWFRKYKKIGIIRVPPKYECYYMDINIANMTDSIKAEIKEIELKGWSKAEKDFKVHEDSNIKGKPLATKTFPYNPHKLKLILFWGKLRFKSTGTYLVNHTMPHCYALVSAVFTVILIV